MAKEQKLLEILARESSKMGRAGPRTPSQFRDTMQDTHATLQPEYYGPTPQRLEAARTQSAAGNAAGRTAGTRMGRRGRSAGGAGHTQQGYGGTYGAGSSLFNGQPEFRSVFRPKPEQEAVCAMATTRRKGIEGSEWALLDTLEVDMYLREKEARAAALLAAQAKQRAALDTQVALHEAQKLAELEERAFERTVVVSEVERHRQEEAAKAAAARVRNTAMRHEREGMLRETRAARSAAADAKRREEEAELAAAQAALEADRVKAAAKQAAAREQWLATAKDNEARIAARRAASEAQKAEDEALMAQTIATLERQEREREEKVKAFHAMIEARANKAGLKAVEENRERQEREARLMAQFEAQKEAEDKAKEAQLAAKKAAQKQELLNERERVLARKAGEADARRAQVERERADAEARAAAEAEAEARKMAGIRARAAQNKDFLRGQIAARDEAAVYDDVGMSDRERQLNARLLNQALHITGGPKQYSVRLY